MLKGTKFLRVGAVLEIIVGAVSLLAVWGILGATTETFVPNETVGANVLLSAVAVYGIHIFEVVAGLFGLVRANHKSYVALLFGAVLFFSNFAQFFMYESASVMETAIHAISLVVPYVYFQGAVMNMMRSK